MKIPFHKMHGLGNDFLVIDGTGVTYTLNADIIRDLADRHRGIGFDQLLLLEKSRTAAADFYYRVFNADGGEVAQCGNGARCMARFIHDQKLSGKTAFTLQTREGLLSTSLQKDGNVAVDMGKPLLNPRDVPFAADQFSITYPLIVANLTLEISAIGLGNPHCVLVVDDVSQAPVATLGREIETHPRFPKRVNVGFMQVLDRRQINLRVYERGAGETQACGSGACAAVVAGRLRNLLDDTVTVNLPGGKLSITWKNQDDSILMIGPAVDVFSGTITIPDPDKI